jgi:release factor glutamine methyltransferase
MIIKELLRKTEKFFKKYKIPQPRLDAEVLLADLLDMERIKLYVNFDYPLKKDELIEYRKRVTKISLISQIFCFGLFFNP